MVTILDVARQVGVSKATVSNVLNSKGRVSEATKKAVFKAIEELDYRPNVLAQSLSKQVSDTIGLLIPSGYHTSRYITRLIDMTQELANKAGKFLMITQVDGNDIELGIQSIRKLIDRRCDGIIYYKSSHIEEIDIQNKLETLIEELPVPLVVLNYNLPNKPDYCVWFDHVAIAQLAVVNLIERGHKKIAYISGQQHMHTSRARLQGYQDAMKKAGLELNSRLIAGGSDSHYQGGYDACKKLIKRELDFSAICCYSDAMAIGALKALKENGISVPEDVSIFGLDNDYVGDFMDPPISSIDVPVDDIISIAGKLLLEHMQNKLPTSKSNSLTGQLVHRKSVKDIID
ncbi:LacI family DNA-binding transcriptional regulator [Photobacterium rosenbergii]|uniref:LacI family DNA-binding transcriptional regulator n=1 Tax=Photobacterium rosenbergii TaxID=294936 RepID=A0ABU3ZNA9_9GAMM|nr:LacI family DNA-binding transcriptional regulator [Photobacterium rosenbergii]MDV5171602.1 LacI family DNA-binding transcriptional regulator [Photobacterium rosenbergii]